jgi:GGDEF domain-containing protein
LSVGAASYPQDGTDAASLLQHADELMYTAKRSTVPAMLWPGPVPQR